MNKRHEIICVMPAAGLLANCSDGAGGDEAGALDEAENPAAADLPDVQGRDTLD